MVGRDRGADNVTVFPPGGRGRTLRDIPKALGLVACMALPSSSVVQSAEPIVGRPSVTDGDTVAIRDIRIRLHGIDSPESGQACQDSAGKKYRCGQAAALALADKIGSSSVSCEPRDTDRYGRTVAVCRLAAEDLNAWMVAQGHAIAYRRYALDYVDQENEAKAAKRGIWAGSFQFPADWRRAQRSEGRQIQPSPQPAPAVSTPSGCSIKGNISRKGDKIYHLPGSRDYDRTIISANSGERMFCSEDEAKAAGWRTPNG